jgi:ankyrin repeat protein
LRRFFNEITTPLHLAAKEGHSEILDYLLEKGADVSVKDYKDRNPLEMAIEKSKK